MRKCHWHSARERRSTRPQSLANSARAAAAASATGLFTFAIRVPSIARALLRARSPLLAQRRLYSHMSHLPTFVEPLTARSDEADDKGALAKLITWNILADGPGLALSSKHDYCPLELREWPKRSQRILAALTSFNADLVCLQECSADAFKFDLRPGLGGDDLPPNALAPPPTDADGLAGFHWSAFLPTEYQRERARTSSTGLAIFVRPSLWEPVAAKAVLFASLVEDGRHSGRLRDKLRSQGDGALLLLVRCRSSGQRLLLVNTHLFWDPHWPHVKACQAELCCTAARAFLEEACAPPPGAPLAPGASPPPGAPPPALVICGDFNSVPHLQPAFLPEEQRALLPAAAERSAEWEHSAAYALLATGEAPSHHPEHPDSYGRTDAPPPPPPHGADADAIKPRKRAKHERRLLGPLRHQLGLRDAYAGALAPGPLPLSTRADDFAGTLDYIWLDDRARVRQVLGMPYPLERPEELGQIPDALWPSDHLPLGVQLQLQPTAGAEVAPGVAEVEDEQPSTAAATVASRRWPSGRPAP